MFGKVFLWIIGILIFAGAVFCLTALIMSSCHNLSFVQEIQNWFHIETAQAMSTIGADMHSISLTALLR